MHSNNFCVLWRVKAAHKKIELIILPTYFKLPFAQCDEVGFRPHIVKKWILGWYIYPIYSVFSNTEKVTYDVCNVSLCKMISITNLHPRVPIIGWFKLLILIATCWLYLCLAKFYFDSDRFYYATFILNHYWLSILTMASVF